MNIPFSKAVCLVIFALCYVIEVYGQSTNPLPSNTFNSNSYNVPSKPSTNFYTGQPVLDFPLHNYADSYLSFGTSFSYSGTGTTVAQVGSSIGLGWTLNIGGYVRRQVIGTPDEFSYTSNNVTKRTGYLNIYGVNPNPGRAELEDFYYGKLDGELDDYSFSIPGFSGKIIINKYNEVAATVPASNLIVKYYRQPNYGTIYLFTITTEDGIQYEFAKEETLRFKTKLDNVDYTFDYTSTWLLTKITPFNNPYGAINLVYDPYTSNDIVGWQSSAGKPTDPNVTKTLGLICGYTQGGCCIVPFTYKGEDLKLEGTLQRLNTVNFPDGSSIRFNYSGKRCDMNDALALLSVAVYDSPLLMRKKFNFQYQYASIIGVFGFNDCGGALDLNKRLLLERVTESTPSGEELPPLIFNYETDILLPNRNSNASTTDAWGFAVTNGTADQSKAYLLKRIRYPAGAIVDYQYESNTVGWTKSSGIAQTTLRGARIKRIVINEGRGSVPAASAQQIIEYTYESTPNNSSGQVDYLPIKEFRTRLDLNKIGNCQILSDPYNNIEYTDSINHSPINPFPTGNACGYSKVTEEIKSGSLSMGRNVYYFKNFKDYADDPVFSGLTGDMQFPFPSKQYHISWGLGLLNIKEVYDNAGRLVEKKEYQYDTYANKLVDPQLASIKVGLLYGPVNRSSSAANGDVFKYEVYYPITGKARVIKEIESNISYPTGSASPETYAKEFQYEYVPNKDLVRNKISFDSKGNKIRKTYYYAFDYPGITVPNTARPDIAFFNTNKITTPVIAEETWLTKNGAEYLTDLDFQRYQLLSNGTFKPSKDYSLIIQNPILSTQVPVFDPANTAVLFRWPQDRFRETESNDIYTAEGNVSQTIKKRNYPESSIYDVRFRNLPVARFTNARLSEVAYTGFEDISFNPVNTSLGNFIVNGVLIADAFTGAKSLYGKVAVTMEKGRYVMTCWSKGSIKVSFSNTGATGKTTLIQSVNEWGLYRSDISITDNNTVITIRSDDGPFDEIKIAPGHASVETVTYGPNRNRIAVLTNDVATYFEYDAFNRLISKKDADQNIIDQTEYTYRLTSDGYKNKLQPGPFMKNNCPAGEVGMPVNYSVPAGKYTSAFSQAEADAQAIQDGQSYANNNGSCGISFTVDDYISVPFTPPSNCTGAKVVFFALADPQKVYTQSISCESPAEVAISSFYRGKYFRFIVIVNTPEPVALPPVDLQVTGL